MAGNKIIEERKVKIRDQALNESAEITEKIKRLKESKLDSESKKAELHLFKVSRSRFRFEKNPFSEDVVIELTVKNETKYPVSRVYFEGTLSSPGRSIPWVHDTFNYKIPGGIEVGEEVTWKLTPNMFGEWGKAPRDRDDYVLTVIVLRLDGVDGTSLYDLQSVKDIEGKIERLESRLAELSVRQAGLFTG